MLLHTFRTAFARTCTYYFRANRAWSSTSALKPRHGSNPASTPTVAVAARTLSAMQTFLNQTREKVASGRGGEPVDVVGLRAATSSSPPLLGCTSTTSSWASVDGWSYEDYTAAIVASQDDAARSQAIRNSGPQPKQRMMEKVAAQWTERLLRLAFSSLLPLG